MDTVLTIEVVGHGAGAERERDVAQAVDRAMEWFFRIEAICSRFDTESEVSKLAARPGEPVKVSDTLFEAVRVALAVAEECDGAFDPTVGYRMAARGFDREYRTGRAVPPPSGAALGASYRDVRLDVVQRTVELTQPLMLDLGAVAKGLAIDVAARELAPLTHFAIDAGGDQFFAGRNAQGEPWSIGIRHPREPGALLESIAASDAAVCTSGDYVRVAPGGRDDDHHILDPRTGTPARLLASVTVVAPIAIVADALATAAFVLGPVQGAALLERHGVDGLLVTPALERHVVRGPRAVFGAA